FTSVPTNKAENSPPEKPEHVSVADPVLLDDVGSPITRVRVGERVVFQSEITNAQDKQQPFIYLVQIKNSEGIIISISYAKSEIPPNDIMKAAQSWLPTETGKYYAEIFVWDSIDGHKVLSPARKISVQVSEF
ncbi:MAG: hypothetical protein HZA83_02440, partial [Thaumarchaeota archaeon]|nr:hypothetical protein [Nitrososphaerota archaeon]